jgi:hypothetical protein
MLLLGCLQLPSQQESILQQEWPPAEEAAGQASHQQARNAGSRCLRPAAFDRGHAGEHDRSTTTILLDS